MESIEPMESANTDAVALEAADGDLPMLVWLRGDEPYAGEFSLDAEHVMGQLGIRRSRLTQISGKELRVGRIRRGRYVAPVYRQIDVATYQSWTRPTASHAKSSALLHEAAAGLKDETARIADSLDQTIREARFDLERLIRSGTANTATLVREPVLEAKADIAAMRAEHQHQLAALLTAQKAQAEMLATLARGFEDIRAAQRRAAATAEYDREEDLASQDAVADLIQELKFGLAAAISPRARLPKPKHDAARARRLAARLNRESKLAPPASAGGKSRASRKSGTGKQRSKRKSGRGQTSGRAAE